MVGALEDIIHDLEIVRGVGSELGMHLNCQKSEVISTNPATDSPILSAIPSDQVLYPVSATLLGSPIGDVASITSVSNYKIHHLTTQVKDFRISPRRTCYSSHHQIHKVGCHLILRVFILHTINLHLHTCSSTFPLLTKPLWATGDLSVKIVCYKTARLPGHRPMVRLLCACFHTSQDDELQPPTPPTRTNIAQCINHCNCNLRKGTQIPYKPICKLQWLLHCDVLVLVGGHGSCSCMLLLHPLLTCMDAGPNLCTFCPNLCTLHPDLCTLCLWCHLSINQCKYSTCTHGGDHWMACASGKYSLHRWWCHPVQLALVVVFLSPTGAHTLLAIEQLALCGCGSCMWMWRWCL